MKPSIRLTLAACAVAVAVVTTGCGHKTTAVSHPAKQAETSTTAGMPAKTAAAKVPSAKPSAASPFNPGQPAQPLAAAAKLPLGAPTPAVGKAVPPVRPLVAKPTAAQLIAVLRSRYWRFASLRADGTSTTVTRADGRMIGKPQTSKATLLFARPNKVSISSNAGRFIIDGKSIYNYSPMIKRYSKGKFTEGVMRQLAMSKPGISVMGLLLGVQYPKLIASAQLLNDTNIGGRDVYVLKLRTKSGVATPRGVDASETVWIAKSDLGIYRSEVTVKFSPKAAKGAKGKLPKQVVTTMSSTLTRFEPNAKLPASTFTFKPPAGAKLMERPKIVDMSDKTAADLTFKWADGSTRKLSDLRGKIVVLEFWAMPMCAPHLPALQTIYTKYGHDVACVFVNLNSNKAKVQEYLKKNHFTFPVVFADTDMAKTVSADYKAVALPTMFLIDEKGVIREEMLGNSKVKDIEAKLDKIRK